MTGSAEHRLGTSEFGFRNSTNRYSALRSVEMAEMKVSAWFSGAFPDFVPSEPVQNRNRLLLRRDRCFDGLGQFFRIRFHSGIEAFEDFAVLADEEFTEVPLDVAGEW